MLKYYFISLFFMAVPLLASTPSGDPIVFDQLTNKNGLSHNNVVSILQDKRGYIWIATQEGLNRYDGYAFKHFQHAHKDTSSLSKNQLRTLFEDSQGYIWVGTSGGGLNRLDPQTERFQKVKLYKADLMQSGNAITTGTMAEDRFGYLWAGTMGGLFRIDLSTLKATEITFKGIVNPAVNMVYVDSKDNVWVGTFDHGLFKIGLNGQGHSDLSGMEQWSHDAKRAGSLGSNTVMSLLEDSSGIIWVGHTNGLDRWNESTNTFTHFQHDPENTNSLSTNYLNNSMVEDAYGNIWISSSRGLNKLGPDRSTFTSYVHDPGNANSISSDYVNSLLIDQTGTLWVGTINGGINRILSVQPPFELYRHDPHNLQSLSSNVVKVILEDSQGDVWVGTEGGGLNLRKKSTDHFQHFLHDPDNPKSLMSNNVAALLEDSKGRLWVGYAGGNFYKKRGGLSILNKTTQEFDHIAIESSLVTGGADKEVMVIFEDSDGFIWLGTQQGIKKIDPVTLAVEHFHYQNGQPNTISDNWCIAITEDPFGYLWVGTQSVALNRINRKTGEISYYSRNPSDTTGLSSNSIRHIQTDRKGNLWLATNAGGLCHFDQKTGKFSNYTVDEGLPSNTINRIEFDQDQNLWLSTNAGLCRFNPGTGDVLTFDYADGLQSNQFASGYFNLGASHAGKDGILYFGGHAGFNAFDPKNININQYIPPVVITQFKVFEDPVVDWEKEGSITLEYSQNYFSFEFASLNYIHSEKNQYAYQLENVDKEWVYSGSRRYVSYNNLRPGTYTFKVKGSNNDGLWNEQGAAVTLTILPPWWQTRWAYGMYFLLIVFSLIGMKRAIVVRERLKGDLKLKKLEAEKLQELDKTKSDFFANISHEFRTPLALITGTVDRLEEEQKNHSLLLESHRLIKRNADRLLQLVNQLLDLSKLEAGKLTLEKEPGEIVGFAKRLAGTFSSQFESKQIAFFSSYPESPIYLYFDADKLEKVLSNLLINAYKFTPTSGTVRFEVCCLAQTKADVRLQFEITDNGIGIPSERLPYIFDRFYQGEASATRSYEGTGIGLALVRELTELHGGSIHVESSPDSGSCFTVALTLERVDPETISGLTQSESEMTPVSIAKETRPAGIDILNQVSINLAALTTVLIVEDNPELRHFLAQSLHNQYRILEAANGLEGFQVATDTLPDLIISDVMMPVMDGVSLSTQVKNDARTSHIPLVLLTARADSESKISGLQTGADAYLTKPFDLKELKVRVQQLIEGRKKLRERFSRSLSLKPSELAVTSTDENFLKKALAILEENLANTDFDVETFSREIGMSRTNLHRKLKALTDCSANEFIRAVRLKRAMYLLEQKSGNVTEVAYAVGFNSVSYFDKCFKKQFGKKPSDYLLH